jgi:SAM-dependent methyltransferase
VGNRWDDRYRSGEYGEKEPEPVLVRFAESIPPGRALDIACGLGRHSLWLARKGWSVTAVDYSDVALNILRERGAGLEIDILRADIEAAKFELRPAHYDLICDICFLWRPLFPVIRDALGSGGTFIGVYPVAGDRNSPTNPDYLMQPGELPTYFNGWDVIHSFEGRPGGNPLRRLRAEIVARKP